MTRDRARGRRDRVRTYIWIRDREKREEENIEGEDIVR